MTDKVRFPSRTREQNDWRASTTFWVDFTFADRLCAGAVMDAWKKAFEENRDDCRRLLEMCIVMCRKCWQHYHAGDIKLSRMYAGWYHECYGYAFRDDTTFTDEEQTMFYELYR